MKNLLFLFFISVFTTLPFSGKSCCVADQYVLTELLNDPTETRYKNHSGRSIFIVEIDSAGSNPKGGYMSSGIVQEVFRGDLEVGKKVNIGSGGNTSAGGSKLFVGKKYIIFSRPDKQGDYYAFVCDGFSSIIYETEKEKKTYSRRGADTEAVVRKYFRLQKEKYSGKVTFKIDGKVIGKGKFKNGLAHGKWKHYNHSRREKYLKSEINYKYGRQHGTEKIYRQYQKNKLSKITEFESGRPVKITNYVEQDGQYYLYGTTEIKYNADNLERRKSIVFYPDGKMKSLYHINFTGLQMNNQFYADKYENGEHKLYFPNGQLQTSGRFHLGAKIGKWYTFAEDGQLLEEKEYALPDDTVASFVLFHKNGKPRITGLIKDGKREGEWKTFSEEGGLMHFGNFQNGELHGKFQAFRLEEKTIYRELNYKNGVLHGDYLNFFKNGKDIQSRSFYTNGKKNGEDKRFFEDGTIRHQAFYINGKLEGALVSYHTPTILAQKEYYQNGLQQGVFEKYYEDGQLRSKGNYENGIQTGTWFSYYKNGNLRSKCEFSLDNPKSKVGYSVPDSCESFEEDGSLKKRRKRKYK